MSTPLPATPSLEQLRKQAKDLVRAHPGEPLGLAGAQLAVAREHGFPSWRRLKAYVERVAAHGPALQHAYHEDLDYYDGRAHGLLASAEDGTEGAVAAFERHGAPRTRAGARTVVAREHGFPSWPALRRHVAALRESAEPFARAYRAVETHDAKALSELLDRFPQLVAARGTNGNDLLGMATATCDERVVALLLERGADPARANAHGWTPLHQAAYTDRPGMAQRLLDAGAPVDRSARGDGGTPLVVALFWGNRRTAELLAARGLLPRNLRVAAGLGRLDVIDELTVSEAGARREFYRPHSGFPAWRPSDEPGEILGEALSWAARNDRVEAPRRRDDGAAPRSTERPDRDDRGAARAGCRPDRPRRPPRRVAGRLGRARRPRRRTRPAARHDLWKTARQLIPGRQACAGAAWSCPPPP